MTKKKKKKKGVNLKKKKKLNKGQSIVVGKAFAGLSVIT